MNIGDSMNKALHALKFSSHIDSLFKKNKFSVTEDRLLELGLIPEGEEISRIHQNQKYWKRGSIYYQNYFEVGLKSGDYLPFVLKCPYDVPITENLEKFDSIWELGSPAIIKYVKDRVSLSKQVKEILQEPVPVSEIYDEGTIIQQYFPGENIKKVPGFLQDTYKKSADDMIKECQENDIAHIITTYDDFIVNKNENVLVSTTDWFEPIKIKSN